MNETINDYKKEINYLISLKLKLESLRKDFHHDSRDAFEIKNYSGYQTLSKIADNIEDINYLIYWTVELLGGIT